MDRAFEEIMDNLLTDQEKLALYGVARLTKEREPSVPAEPVSDAKWPVRDADAAEALA
jgi:hypothetical protein